VKKIGTILGIIISVGVIAGAVWSFEQRKVDRTLYEEQRKVDRTRYEEHVAYTDIRFMEQYRKELQQRIWTIMKSYPNQYHSMTEYQRLVQELRQIDMKIRAFYMKRGG